MAQEDNWILISASTFNLFWHTVLAEIYEENLASHRYVVEQVKKILSLLGQLWIFFFDTVLKTQQVAVC